VIKSLPIKTSYSNLIVFIFLLFLLTEAANAQEWVWEQTNGPYGGDVQCLAINSSDDVFAGTLVGDVYRYTDNGDKWTQIFFHNHPLINPVQALAINSSGDIFAGTWGDFVYRSTDNGNNWTHITGLPNFVPALAINSSGDIFAGTYGGGVFRSTDNGDNWTQINNGMTNTDVMALAINSSGDIFAGSWGGGVFRSIDNGNSWMQINTGLTNTYVLVLAINSARDIFAGTEGGGVFRAMYSTDVFDENQFNLPRDFTLSQNYPNPFNPTTTIEYSLQTRVDVTITVFDILGRRVKMIFDQTMPVGTHTAYWDGTDIDNNPVATGVYFYQIKAGDFVETKKMVLLK